MSQDQDEGGWGWEPFGSEDDQSLAEPVDAEAAPQKDIDIDVDAADKRTSPEKSPVRRDCGNSSLGITSSPSFQELERAIGATLASNLSNTDLAEAESASKASLPSRLSSTNLTQKKVQHQRTRQLQQQSAQRNISYVNQRYAHHQSTQMMNHVLVSTKAELSPYINEEESRALVIFHSPNVLASLINEVCSRFGVLYYIRPEFHQKGVTFISYFDLQAATTGKESIALLMCDNDCSVHYSIMLHATNSNSEESRLIIKNLPSSNVEQDVQAIVSRYGPLRSIQKTFGSGEAGTKSLSPATYTIEYFNIQDARLAASELSATSTTLWGPDIITKFAPLDDRKQQLCKQLLSTLSRWRTDMAMVQSGPQQPLAPMMASPMYGFPQNFGYNNMHQNIPYGLSNENPMAHWNGMFGGAPIFMPLNMPSVDPHGMGYFYQPESPAFAQSNYYFPTPENENARLNNAHSNNNNSNHDRTAESSKIEYFRNLETRNIGNRKQNNKPPNGRDYHSETEFSLDIQRILAGEEQRTTIMVRNIPNKYTQQMLLEEVNVSFQGTYDFFYLPIDFKNHCNVGYGFINFIEPMFIPRFVELFHGQKWKNFNSEKVCAVSFARIQGKHAMISRFQNSSLLDKQAEYKPLLFFSSGSERGQPEPFPTIVRAVVRNSLSEEDVGST